MLEAYLYTGLRSPFGRHAGALARLRPDDMLAGIIAKVVAESGFAADKIEDVVDRKSTRLNSSHIQKSRMPSSA